MKFITNVKLYDNVNTDEITSNTCKSEHPNKQIILEYLKNASFVSSCTTDKVIDCVTNKKTNIQIVAYHDDKYYWDDRYIYHFEKYNFKLNDDFIQYVLNRPQL